MTFKPGVSGNPLGRPSLKLKQAGMTHSLAMLARRYTHEAVKVMAQIMKDKNAPANARVTAASHILDRGHGKAPTINTDDAKKLKRALDLTDDELAAIVADGKDGSGGDTEPKKDSVEPTNVVPLRAG